jgi:hypothetical protein
MLRLRLPQLIYAADELTIKPKDDDDQMMGMQEKQLRKMGKLGGQLIGAQIDWNTYVEKYASVARDQLISSISGRMLQTTSHIDESTLKKHIDASSREAYIRTVTVQLMSTPEYQLC